MENYLQGLNEQQLKAVTTRNKYVRIIAGAGSGKTRVLTTRIAHLIGNWGISSEAILAITFTNKAANEMRNRIEKILGPQAMGIRMSTIHSFCVYFLRNEIFRENYPSNFTILDVDDQKSILKEAYKEYEYSVKDYPFNAVLDYIANCKCAGFGYEDALSKAYSPHYENMAKLYKYYLNRCEELYALDFDDLLLWTNKILKKYPQVREKWQNKYQFILVDEFQDIDDIQNELINLLTSKTTYLYVVGDPDQTIYSWRGANINIIMGFENTYSDTETIILNQNYRSTQNILNGANSVIQYNRNRVKKDLFTDNNEGNKIVHFTASSDDNEALYVITRINDLLSKKGYSFKDMAILYRSSYLSRSLEKKLVEFKIPYVIYGGVRFFERAEIKDILSYMRMITSSDDLSFKRIINTPRRGIGDKSVDRLFEIARNNHVSLMQAIDYWDGSSATGNKFNSFKVLIESLKTKCEAKSIEEIFQIILEDTGYREMLENSKDPNDMERLDNIKELMNDVISYQNTNNEATLADYLANVALYTDIQSNNDGDFLSLMTIHAAKGLEFDVVFVIQMSEGIFPSIRTMEDSGTIGLEEERRLAYVAYTRARKLLFLSDNNGYAYASAGSKQTSRFVTEIDSRYLIQMGLSSTKQENTSVNNSVSDNKNSNVKKVKLKKGDLVEHKMFGQGVIISIEEEKNIGKIAFGSEFGIKNLSLDFVSKVC